MDLPILKDPHQILETDYLITESTYAGRLHDSTEETEEELGEITMECLRRKGKIVVPAFSVGRHDLLKAHFMEIGAIMVVTKAIRISPEN